jgi:hypothetical protein
VNIGLRVLSGGEAAIVNNEGERVVLESSVASPPGSTLEVERDGLVVRVKVRSCRRDPSGAARPFRIEGRLVSFDNAARKRLFGATEE